MAKQTDLEEWCRHRVDFDEQMHAVPWARSAEKKYAPCIQNAAAMLQETTCFAAYMHIACPCHRPVVTRVPVWKQHFSLHICTLHIRQPRPNTSDKPHNARCAFLLLLTRFAHLSARSNSAENVPKQRRHEVLRPAGQHHVTHSHEHTNLPCELRTHQQPQILHTSISRNLSTR